MCIPHARARSVHRVIRCLLAYCVCSPQGSHLLGFHFPIIKAIATNWHQAQQTHWDHKSEYAFLPLLELENWRMVGWPPSNFGVHFGFEMLPP